jgi:hypothetical protein
LPNRRDRSRRDGRDEVALDHQSRHHGLQLAVAAAGQQRRRQAGACHGEQTAAPLVSHVGILAVHEPEMT